MKSKQPALPYRAAPIITTRPWASSSEAAAVLDGAATRRLEAFQASLAMGWNEPFGGMGNALDALFPDTLGVIDDGSFGAGWILSNRNGIYEPGRVDPFVNAAAVQRARDSIAAPLSVYDDRALNFTTFYSLIDAKLLERHRAEVMEPNGLGPQLRVKLTGRYPSTLCLIKSGTSSKISDFGVNEIALLDAATNSVRRWAEWASVLGLNPIGTDASIHILDALAEPSWLVSRGKIIYANLAARLAMPHTPAWVARSDETPPGVSRVKLGEASAEVELVKMIDRSPVSVGDRTIGVPAYLSLVAERLAEGASDKEIANETGMSLRTTRTYVTRVLQHLGAHSRRELMVRLTFRK